MSWLSRLFDPLRGAREANDAMIADAKKRELAKFAVEKKIASIQLDYDYNERSFKPMPFWEFQEKVELADRYKTIARVIQIAPNGTFSALQLHAAEELRRRTIWWTDHSITYPEMLSLNEQLSGGHGSLPSESA